MKVDCGYTENYFKEKNRMIKNCVIACEDCPISNDNNKTDLPCEVFERTCPDKAIEIVQKWSDEHQQETRAEHFMKMYPNARMLKFIIFNFTNSISYQKGVNKKWKKI